MSGRAPKRCNASAPRDGAQANTLARDSALRWTRPSVVTAASCWVSTSPTFSLRRAPLCAVRLCYLTCFQSDLTVDQAVSLWPKVAAKARACGSPAMASNYTWLQDFLKSAQVSPSRLAPATQPSISPLHSAPTNRCGRAPLRHRCPASPACFTAGFALSAGAAVRLKVVTILFRCTNFPTCP